MDEITVLATPTTPRGPRARRRQLLGGAAVLGVGAVLAALYEAHPTAQSAPPLPDSVRLGHLLRRAGFGASPEELTTYQQLGVAGATNQLLNFEAIPNPIPDKFAQLFNFDFTNGQQLQRWWLLRMLYTARPLEERMTLFWHGVLTGDFRNSARVPFVYQQNVLYRSAGLSNLRGLLSSVTRDPLMMRYLNLDASTAASPNENFARELMELFTLGPGNYSETDVREGARALSGLRIQLFDATGTRTAAPRYSKSNPQAYVDQINSLVSSGATFRGAVVPRVHDPGGKTFLGHTGNLGPDDVIDIVLAQPSCAPFVTRRAMTFFAAPNPSAADVNAVAAQFRASNYDVRTLMRAIFRSSAFTAPSNYRSLMRSPTDYMVAAMRALNRPELATTAARSSAGMDQVLYDPPNVAGWPSNSGWISSSSLLARVNFATAATARTAAFPDVSAAVRTQLDSVLGTDTATALTAARTDADRWFTLLASPDFHLK